MERGRGDECRREASGKLRPGMSAALAQEQAIPRPADDGDCHGHTEPDAVTRHQSLLSTWVSHG